MILKSQLQVERMSYWHNFIEKEIIIVPLPPPRTLTLNIVPLPPPCPLTGVYLDPILIYISL